MSSSSAVCDWASTLHPQALPCRVDGAVTLTDSGTTAYFKIVFGDNTAWTVQFPCSGPHPWSDDSDDDHVAVEVRALQLISHKTSIPVPVIRAWGPAARNPLGLGPFVATIWTDGVRLGSLLEARGTDQIQEDDMVLIYQQVAGFVMQLLRLDLHRLRNKRLGRKQKGESSIPDRSLIFRNPTIDSHPGGRTGTALESKCLRLANRQNHRHLVRSPPVSIDRPYDMKGKQAVTGNRADDHAHLAYDRDTFALLCHRLGLTNLMVRGPHDLIIVAVTDLNWSDAASAQLFGPAHSVWDYEKKGSVVSTPAPDRYVRTLMLALQTEEASARMHGRHNREIARLRVRPAVRLAARRSAVLSAGQDGRRNLSAARRRTHLASFDLAVRPKDI